MFAKDKINFYSEWSTANSILKLIIMISMVFRPLKFIAHLPDSVLECPSSLATSVKCEICAKQRSVSSWDRGGGKKRFS